AGGNPTFMNPYGIDDFLLPNYIYNPADGFLRDPERLKTAPAAGTWRTNTSQPRGPYTGGFNAPYTAVDMNSPFLASVDSSGNVLVPSYDRGAWTGFQIFDPVNGFNFWTAPPDGSYKYRTFRPMTAY